MDSIQDVNTVKNKTMKEFKITEATKIISQFTDQMTVTEENGMRVTVFEPVSKPALDVGEWIVNGNSIVLCLDPMKDDKVYFKAVGFFCGKWYGEKSTSQAWEKRHEWKRSDMKEVKRLLIFEAKKRGADPRTLSIGPDQHGSGLHVWIKSVDKLFNSDTGQWAEISGEKNLLYKNKYGEEFFKGDNYKTYTISKACLTTTTHCLIDGSGFESSDIFSETETSSERFKTIVSASKWIVANYK